MRIYVNIYDKHSDVVSEEVKSFKHAVDWYNRQLENIPEKDLEWVTGIVDIVDDTEIAVQVSIEEVMDAIAEV